MSRIKINRIMVTSLFFILFFIAIGVNAEEYDTLDSRIYQNNTIINNSNRMSVSIRESYKDKYLKDIGELNYKGISTNQYSEIQKFVNNTVLEGVPSSYSDRQKLEKFYDWILDNFYYYSTPDKITSLNGQFDNPYYLLTEEFYSNGKVRARGNGYIIMLISFARSQNMPARIVGGYYNQDVREDYIDWIPDLSNERINHVWAQIYVDGKWIMMDPVADSYKVYDDINDEYDGSHMNTKIYFDPSVDVLSKTHIAFNTYSGTKNYKYVSNNGERSSIVSFLNTSSNGKKINPLYDSSDSNTWFGSSDKLSKVNSSGNVTNIYWPSKKGLSGKLKLNSFSKLVNLSIMNNNVTELSMVNDSSLMTVNVPGNKMTRIVVKGNKNISSINTTGNPSMYIEYSFNNNKRAVLKSTTGGTIAVKYNKTKGKHYHRLMVTTKPGYRFQGWYRGNRLISKSKNVRLSNNKSFTYTAKYIKLNTKTYIKVSISKQKLWYYKNGRLKYTSKIVTGTRRKHDTPKGTFTIQNKARKVYLVGEDYRSYVNYWMPFSGPYGLHDATWRGSFGGSIYKYNGSHGCVNLPYKTAKYLYNHAGVGTVVKIVK